MLSAVSRLMSVFPDQIEDGHLHIIIKSPSTGECLLVVDDTVPILYLIVEHSDTSGCVSNTIEPQPTLSPFQDPHYLT
jgi:hypothetical protein